MGRKRKHNDLGLPPRVYLRHGAFYYVHPNTGKWERIGTDIEEAKRRASLYQNVDGSYGTMAYWIGLFLIACKQRVGLPKKRRGISQRTYDDYSTDAVPLKAYFGKMLPHQVQGHHIGAYLDMGAAADRAIRANREIAALSACFTWLRRQPEAALPANPCFGIERNPESKRDRYVEHDEYQYVYEASTASMQALMELIYRTLQRPEDIIEWTAANVVKKREPDGTIRKVIRNDQAKTGTIVDIAVTPELEAVLARVLPNENTLAGPGYRLIHTRHGKPYTYDGLSAMLRRRVYKGVKEGKLSAPFGFYDLKGKGATDMWLAGQQMEKIQVLCGHESVRTTEIYVKTRWRGTVEPNQTRTVAVQ